MKLKAFSFYMPTGEQKFVCIALCARVLLCAFLTFLPRDAMRCAVLVIVIPSFPPGTVTLARGKSCLSVSVR